ncbi:MAG: DUF2889 domain-containing protein [Syntrophales bacterium]|nr:DUF2889 domain-containing protein [Syntrophales bacterium]
MDRELIFRRSITIDTYEIGENVIAVEGELTDERFYPSLVYSTGVRKDKGIMHNMLVKMNILLPNLKILSVSAEMPATPLEGCSEIKDSIKKMENMEIKSGFTSWVRENFGREKGCLHLSNLILAMASAAVQGMWSYYARIREGGEVKRPVGVRTLAVDSCWMWRKDGPLAKRFLEKV